MQAEAAFTAKDYLRAASFYAKVVYLSPLTCALIHNPWAFCALRYYDKNRRTIYKKTIISLEARSI